MDHDILQEQMAYYQARAQEYDESVFLTGRYAADELASDGALGGMNAGMEVLRAAGPFEHILELACGTGIWTKILVEVGKHITAIDASPEMLEINRRKVGDERVRYMQQDLFAWTPDQQYDLVFFAFWLSHVPPEQIDVFLGRVQRAVRHGGRLVVVDEYAPLEEEREMAEQGIYHTRTLYDGSRFTIVKVYYDLDVLRDKLTGLGFNVATQKAGEYTFVLSGQRI